ncbi:DUF1433 domain-containing protein [Staphylococcus hsinchuensis]|uniref:DUF1433 domain-containing protein n=1 Tax=Staphylococcus hsinchuensis TaxID=3051183 RepID=A0ABZ3EFU4_9STAP
MNKNKLFFFLFIVFIIIMLIIGGIYIIHKKQKDCYTNAQEKRIDLYLNENLNGYKNLTLTNTKISPMGAFEIEGYVNHDKKLDFKASIWSEDNNQFEYSMSFSPELSEMLKQSNSSRKKASEIIKEKHLNKEDYEADPPLFF